MKNSSKIYLAGLAAVLLCLPAIIIARLVLAAGTATLSLSPASGTYSQGGSLDVAIYEDSGSDTVNAVQANFSYPTSLLSYSGVTDSSGFTVDAQNSASGGVVQLARGATTPVSGNQLVATVHFTVTGGGTANLAFTSGSAVVRSSDNGAETLTEQGASYTLISPATISLSPSTQSLTTGGALTVSIYENSGGTAVNAVQANLNYPANLLTFVSIDPASGSAFPISAQATGGGGTVKIGRGTSTPVTGNQLVGVVHFTAAAAGAAPISFDSSTTAVVRSSDNGAETLTETGGAYSISTPSSGGGGGTTTPPPATSSKKGSSSAKPSSSPAPSGSTSTPPPPVTTNVDTKAPVISGIKVTNLSLNSATISWQTSEPATSEVDYGLSTTYVLNVTNPALTTHHSVGLRSKDLLGHKTYHFQVKSVDASGNLAFSKDMTFVTQPVSAKSGLSFWAVFAGLIIVAAAAYVGWTYFVKMPGQLPPAAPSAGGPIIGGGTTGGPVIKPNANSQAAPSTTADSVPQEAIILNPPMAAPATSSPVTAAKPKITK